ncbi:MAG: M20/M25/M40 family metallo-hydrolase [Sediminibacterium sp.]
MGKKWFWVLLLVPFLGLSQSKRKIRIEAEKQRAALILNLKSHIGYLASDALEGRRTGTAGADAAKDYLVNQYTQMGIGAKGTSGYLQKFEINEGLQMDPSTYFTVNNNQLKIEKDFFPLATSASAQVTGKPAMALQEKAQPWFKDIKETLEENKSNPHFDVEAWIKNEVTTAAVKGATAFMLYNTGSIVDNIQFNKNDKSAAFSIPVIYLTPSGLLYFTDPSATLNIQLNVQIVEKKRAATNVAAYINNGAANTVVIGAHYDHLGYNEDKNALDTGHVIHNGADDNASGTAALLEIARLLHQKSPTHNNYLFLHFSGEELGLLGSKYWIENPTLTGPINYMINMDMVGRYDTSHKLTVGGYGTSSKWSQIWKAISTPLGVKFDSTGSGPSDHASFYRAGVPVQFFFTGSHSDYHKASDDADKINYEATAQIVTLAYQMMGITDSLPKLDFIKTTEPQMGRSTKFTVSLGVIPDYGYSGTGMRIDGVSPGKLAEKLGLKAGDILLQLGDYKFVDVNSYMQTLSKFKKGDQTELRIKRGSEEKNISVSF